MGSHSVTDTLFKKIQATDVHECMTTDNTMTLAYQNVKKAQTQITTKDYKLRIAY